MKRLLPLIPVVGVLYQDHLKLIQIKGRSMSPALNPELSEKESDLALVRPGFSGLERGDLIVFTNPFDHQQSLVKRVKALPGDVVLDNATRKRLIVPRGRIWVLADNGNDRNRVDSETGLGMVPMGLVQGRIVGLVWPIHRAGFIQRN